MFWDSGVSFGCLVMWTLWVSAVGLLAVATMADIGELGLIGLGATGVAICVTLMREHRQTRRMVKMMVRESQLSRVHS